MLVPKISGSGADRKDQASEVDIRRDVPIM
jgi:hypothetical protein